MAAMTGAQSLGRIIQALDQAGIPYMLTGSLASSYYGTPRSTQDFDIVIAPDPAQLGNFIRALPETDYYADLNAALDACQQESMFNVIDTRMGWKIDLIIRKSRAYSQQEFERRRQAVVEGIPLLVAAVEDVIISKLEWAKLAESDRQIRDVVGILKLRGDSLDRDYLERWITELGLSSQWSDAQRESGTGPGQEKQCRQN